MIFHTQNQIPLTGIVKHEKHPRETPPPRYYSLMLHVQNFICKVLYVDTNYRSWTLYSVFKAMESVNRIILSIYLQLTTTSQETFYKWVFIAKLSLNFNLNFGWG